MLKNREIFIRPLAEKDLDNIYHYSVEEFGTVRAEQYIRDLDVAFRKISECPSIASNYDHIKQGLFAYNVVSHIVFFKFSDSEITIIRVLHRSMDYVRHL